MSVIESCSRYRLFLCEVTVRGHVVLCPAGGLKAWKGGPPRMNVVLADEARQGSACPHQLSVGLGLLVYIPARKEVAYPAPAKTSALHMINEQFMCSKKSESEKYQT